MHHSPPSLPAVLAVKGFGDLANQLRRAVLPVAANIAEGQGMGSDRQFARYLRSDDVARIGAAAEALLAVSPVDGQALHVLGVIARQTGDRTRLERHLRGLDPATLGAAELNLMGDLDRAIGLQRQAVELDPESQSLKDTLAYYKLAKSLR